MKKNKEIIEMENSFGDTFVKYNCEYGGKSKKQNDCFWDSIDGIAQDAVENIAKMVGIESIEWDDYSLVKEVVEVIVSGVEERFNTKFKYIE